MNFCNKFCRNLTSILIKFGANINIINKVGETALSVAVANLNIQGAQILLDQKDKCKLINFENKQGLSLLSSALAHEELSIELVKLLLENGSIVKEEHVKQMVIDRGRFDIADLLIEYADLTIADNSS